VRSSSSTTPAIRFDLSDPRAAIRQPHGVGAVTPGPTSTTFTITAVTPIAATVPITPVHVDMTVTCPN
jgi:hypothetical protein